MQRLAEPQQPRLISDAEYLCGSALPEVLPREYAIPLVEQPDPDAIEPLPRLSPSLTCTPRGQRATVKAEAILAITNIAESPQSQA